MLSWKRRQVCLENIKPRSVKAWQWSSNDDSTHIRTNQISKLTEKMNKISKDLSSERMAAERLQKDNSGQLSQHVTENRKLALEISKLKVIQ